MIFVRQADESFVLRLFTGKLLFEQIEIKRFVVDDEDFAGHHSAWRFRFLIIRIDDSHAHSVAVQMVIAQMAAMRLLARDLVFAQGIVIAGRVDVDDIAAAGVFEHGSIAVERVLADRRKLEVAKLASCVWSFADAAFGAPCRAGKNQSGSNHKQDCPEPSTRRHG